MNRQIEQSTNQEAAPNENSSEIIQSQLFRTELARPGETDNRASLKDQGYSITLSDERSPSPTLKLFSP